jgi:hypothetical protein
MYILRPKNHSLSFPKPSEFILFAKILRSIIAFSEKWLSKFKEQQIELLCFQLDLEASLEASSTIKY